MVEQSLDQAQRVRGVPVLAHQDAADIIARQGGFELAQLVGVEFVGLDPVLAAQFPGEPVLFQALRRAVDVKMAEPVNEVLGAGVMHQRRQRFERRANQRAQRAGLRMNLFRRAGADEADQPGGDRRQIGPAQRQRPERVEQPARHVPHHPRHRHRRHRGGVECAGIAKGGAMTGLAGLDDKDAMAVALQPARGAHADHAGADYADPPRRAGRHLTRR